ncbi:MAG: hypothetical protein IJ298_06980 [Ruminococcus sp.]|nr:hypothetical protein [Ruminococcus sp.]
MNKQKQKPSFAAILMYCIIGVTALICAVCFALYYSNILNSSVLLWAGITCFTIMYHLWLRIIMGNVTKLFKVSYKQWWFKERAFESKLYSLLKVKNWKGKALTYNPELYDIKNRTLGQIADTTAKSELDHWVNVLIALSTVCFGIIWGQVWIFAVTAFFAAVFDSQFIIIQRYNRPRLVRLISRSKQKTPASIS